MDSTLPGCLGCYSNAVPPNGPCRECKDRDLCQRVAQNFVPKSKLKPILGRVEDIEQLIQGDIKK